MLMICLMIFSVTNNLYSMVTVDKDAQGNTIYLYQFEDHKKVEAALIELKEYRVEFPLLKKDYGKLLNSRALWKNLSTERFKEIKTLKIKKDIAIGSTIILTVVTLILAVFK